MTNKEKYVKAFVEGLAVDENKVEGLEYGQTSDWDSVGHMNLIAALEEAFDIMMETDDIIDLSSYAKGIELLAKYDVIIE